jgi:hypothetical protein
MEWASKELKIKEMSDWYHKSNQVISYFFKKCSFFKDLIDLGGSFLLVHGAPSLHKLLSVIYPEYNWLPWKFDKSPKFFWGDTKNQRKFMEWASKELKIKEMSDWYQKSHQVKHFLFFQEILIFQDLLELGGNTLLQMHGRSLARLLSVIYPEYQWLPWRFDKSPQGLWENIDNQKKFVDSMATELKIQSPIDWYNVTKEKIKSFKGGHGILRACDNSLYKLLTHVYPEYSWLPWKFARNLTDDASVEFVARELNVREMSDWYKIKAEVKIYCHFVLNNISKLLMWKGGCS